MGRTNLTNTGEFQRQSFAQDGFRVVDSTFTQPAGETYVALYCLSNAEGLTTTSPNGDALSGVSFQTGMVVYGDFTTVTVTSGTVIAYIQ